MTSERDRARLVEEAERAVGPLDVLVNNAGVEHGGSVVRRSSNEIEQLIATNLAAPMLLARLVLPGMIA